MNRALLIIVVFWGFAASAQYTSPKSDAAVIRSMLANQVIEWNKGSIEGFMKGYWSSDSLVFIGAQEQGYNATLRRYKTKYPDAVHMGKLTLAISSIKKLSDEYYFVIGKWALKRSVGDVDGQFTLLIKRINGALVIVVDHSS